MKRTLTTGLILFLAFLLAACGASNGQTVTNVTSEQTSITSTTVDAVTSADYAGVTINGSLATITTTGTYRLSGSLTDGQIIVDSTVA